MGSTFGGATSPWFVETRLAEQADARAMNAMARLRLTGLFLGLMALGAAAPRHATAVLDPAVAVPQYPRTAWRVRDGFVSSGPYTIGQTTDGYLWIGTQTGLVRFDGARFVPWAPPPGASLPSSAVS
jgi:hypothetical protein